jgi:hypothetical protein
MFNVIHNAKKTRQSGYVCLLKVFVNGISKRIRDTK